MQIYITKEVAVRAIGAEGVDWEHYNPGQFLGDYDVKIQLRSTADKMREVEKQNAMQFFLLASKFPFVNQTVLFKETVAQLFDKDRQEIEGLLQQVTPAKPETKISLKGEVTGDMVKAMVLPSLTPAPNSPTDTPTDSGSIQAAGAKVGNIPGVPQA